MQMRNFENWDSQQTKIPEIHNFEDEQPDNFLDPVTPGQGPSFDEFAAQHLVVS